jgi:LysR family transcriptional regulator, transcriptional activator of the cysJI operon
LRYARQIAAIASEAEQELAAAEGQLAGTLSLGVSTTIAQYILPRLIAAFLAANQRVHLSLHSGNMDQIVELLLWDKISVSLIEAQQVTGRARSLSCKRSWS